MQVSTRIAICFFVALASLLALQAQSVPRAEQDLFASVNRERQAQGLPALKWNEALASAARQHAVLMAQKGSAQHGYPGEPNLASRVAQAGVHFAWLSENVVQGSRAEAIQAEFMHSPNHRANMLDSDMDSIGIGVIEHGGQLFAVEDFAKVK